MTDARVTYLRKCKAQSTFVIRECKLYFLSHFLEVWDDQSSKMSSLHPKEMNK